MPGSPITPSRAGTRVGVPVGVSFRYYDDVGIRDYQAYAAQWLAYYVLLQLRQRAGTAEPLTSSARLVVESLSLVRRDINNTTPIDESVQTSRASREASALLALGLHAAAASSRTCRTTWE
jgi:hypothetical protein